MPYWAGYYQVCGLLPFSIQMAYLVSVELASNDGRLSRLCPRVTDYYTAAMMGLKTDQEVLGELLKVKVPAVWHLMQQHNVMWSLVVSRWFICLFIDVLPVEVGRKSFLKRVAFM